MIVDGATVVGVNEAEVPKLSALVEVGHSGRGELEDGLGEGIDHAKELEPEQNRFQYLNEARFSALFAGQEQVGEKCMHCIKVFRIGVEPAQVNLGFAEGFGGVFLDTL